MSNDYTIPNNNIFGGNIRTHMTTVKMWGDRKSVVVPFKMRGEKKSAIIAVPDPGGADADLTDYPLMMTTSRIIITDIKFWQTAAATQDPQAAGDNLVVSVQKITGTDVELVAKTFTAAIDGEPTSMGAMTVAEVAAGQTIGITLTQGTACNISTTAVQIEYQEVFADLTDRAVWQAPADCQILGLSYIGHGAMTAAAGADGLTMTLEEGANALLAASKLFVADPGADTPTSLGTLHATNIFLTAGDDVTITTASTTAICPDFAIQIDYRERASLTGRHIFRCPATAKAAIKAIYVTGLGTMVAAASPNSVTLVVDNPTGSAGGATVELVSSAITTALVENTATSLGTLSNYNMDESETLTMDVTLGGYAVCPDLEVQVDWVIRDTDTTVGP